jgi:hypothetical protein
LYLAWVNLAEHCPIADSFLDFGARKCYKAASGLIANNWNEARQGCVFLGGHLLTLETEAKTRTFMTLFKLFFSKEEEEVVVVVVVVVVVSDGGGDGGGSNDEEEISGGGGGEEK